MWHSPAFHCNAYIVWFRIPSRPKIETYQKTHSQSLLYNLLFAMCLWHYHQPESQFAFHWKQSSKRQRWLSLSCISCYSTLKHDNFATDIQVRRKKIHNKTLKTPIQLKKRLSDNKASLSYMCIKFPWYLKTWSLLFCIGCTETVPA